eukprot:SAG11_NODE_25002_length_364_cov_75.067925_1_plen_51_part_10
MVFYFVIILFDYIYINMVVKKQMLALLEATEFPKNKGRTNILNKGQTYSHS